MPAPHCRNGSCRYVQAVYPWGKVMIVYKLVLLPHSFFISCYIMLKFWVIFGSISSLFFMGTQWQQQWLLSFFQHGPRPCGAVVYRKFAWNWSLSEMILETNTLDHGWAEIVRTLRKYKAQTNIRSNHNSEPRYLKI